MKEKDNPLVVLFLLVLCLITIIAVVFMTFGKSDEHKELLEEHKNTKCTHCVYYVYKKNDKVLLKYNEQGQLILNDNTATVSWLNCPVFEKQLNAKNNERKINE